MRNVKILNNAEWDRVELAYCKKAYEKAADAWQLRGSDGNIDRLFEAERRYEAVKAAVEGAVN